VNELPPIVLIDPSTETTSALAGRLQMQGYAVCVAHDPAEGARMALADPPAAVIADLWMPGISGVQLCRLLKAEPATEHVPVILRGPDNQRNRFWAERAGASSHVVKGRMGDLVRALRQAIDRAPAGGGFFTTFAGEDIRDRIAAHLDAALFDSVIASEVRALGMCESFERLFDLCSQFVSRIATYRWLAISTDEPRRFGLHVNPAAREDGMLEARAALGVSDAARVTLVEDGDACVAARGPAPLVFPIELGGFRMGRLAISVADADALQDESFVAVIARELAGPIRMVTLVEESQRLATEDALTRLMNRRAFVSAMKTEIERCSRYDLELSLLLFDVDHFKSINDRLGHGAGDSVLAALGSHLAEATRTTDLCARWGGEEFVVALTCTGEPSATLLAERLRASIAALRVTDADGAAIPVTASIGVTSFARGDSLEALIARADQAMYAAKSSGRNRVATHPASSRPPGGARSSPPAAHAHSP
jgi:two-component system cell cycle response regulator